MMTMTGTEAEKAAVATLRAIKRIEKKGKRSEERRQREALLECARKNLEVELYGRGV